MRGIFSLLASAIVATLLASPVVLARPDAPPPRPGASAPVKLSDAAKIEALIVAVEQLQGAVFIRNGSEHDAAKAGAHLRRKLDHAGSKIKTAEQFIDQLATGSSTTGKPYRIRFADGRSVDSAVFFREQLRRIEAPAPKSAKG